jgi:hypothetical protein
MSNSMPIQPLILHRLPFAGLGRLLAIVAIALTTMAGSSLQAEPIVPTSPATDPASMIRVLLRQAPGLHPEVLRLGLSAMNAAAGRGLITRKDLLTVIDYSLPSTTPRLFTFDLPSRKLLFRELVAHGKNSGDNKTTHFSNAPDSLETSLGLFVTAGTYFGRDGYSLRLRGLEKGFNDLAWSRNIVMHGASYVSEATAQLLGRLGRSFGCPAVPKAIAPAMIDTLKGGTAVFAYYPDATWLHESTFLR